MIINDDEDKLSYTFWKIMELPVEQRLALLIERYEDLDEFTGCRSNDEIIEMDLIAQAVMPELIKVWKKGERVAEFVRKASN